MARFIGLPHRTGAGVLGKTGGSGAITAKVRILGVTQALAKLRGVDSVARLNLGLMMKGAAEFIEKRAKENLAPHHVTGNLESGIKTQKVASYSYNVTASSRDGDVQDKNWYEYAPFVEEGTSHMPGVHFMARAYEDVKPLVAVELKAMASKLERL